mgnify:CR=1 FL=1
MQGPSGQCRLNMAASEKTSRSRAMFSSLKFKVATYLALALAIAFAVFTWGLARQQREDLLDTAVAHILQLSDAVIHSTNFMMLQDKPEYVHRIILDVAREKDIDRIRIFSKKGKIIDSTYAPEIGMIVDSKAEGCVSCHKGDSPIDSLADRDRVRFFDDAKGRRMMGMMQVLRNEPSCQTADCHAHKNDPSALGVVDIVYSLEQVEQRVNRGTMRIALLALGFVLLAAIAVSLLVHRLVYRPLRDLETGAERLAAGDLEQPIPVRSTDEFGQLAGSFNTMMNALHQSHTELRDAARLLEQKVEERTQQLRVAEAEALQREKLAATGLLASGIAHELNNPLTGVLTFSHLIRQKMPDGSQDAEDMDLVIRETKRCASIIRRLLDFARQKAPERTNADLNQLIADTARFLERSVHLQGTEMKLDLDPNLPRVWIDENQMKQVVMNMLVNAQHATEGGGTITVTTRRAPEPMSAEPPDEPVDMIEITIADTGCGIPERDLKRIFDPFFTSKEVGKGTGLGLSVSHGVVKAHGGIIRVESAVDHGTTFHIYLPIVAATPPSTTSNEAAHG